MGAAESFEAPQGMAECSCTEVQSDSEMAGLPSALNKRMNRLFSFPVYHLSAMIAQQQSGKSSQALSYRLKLAA